MEEILWDMEGITLADGWNILPHDPARYADAVHPNTDGFACYAQALAGAIRAADKKKGRNQK